MTSAGRLQHHRVMRCNKRSGRALFVLDHGSFHGRGFFPGGIALDDSLIILAAFGAFVGLLIAHQLYRRPHESRLFGKEG